MTADLIVIGLITGTTYGLLGIGLTLIYRLSGTLNLAHGEIGAFGASVIGLLAVRYGWSFPVAIVVGVVGGALLSGMTELVVMKRLGDRSTVVVMVATLGAGQLASLLRISLPDVPTFATFPTLLSTRTTIGPVELTGAELGALVLAPTIALLVWWVLARTTAGAVVRATAANREATRLVGINASVVATFVWVAAGALSVVATATAVPLRGGTAAAVATVGPGLLLRGFAAASVGRLRSVPLTLVGGLALGVAEALAISWSSDPGVTNLVVFVIVLVGLATLPSDGSDDVSATASSRPWTDWPATIRVRTARYGPGVVGVGVLVVVPFLVTSAGNTFQLSRLAIVALVVTSTSMLAGWAGQVSLAQYALAGLGAIVSARLVDQGATWELSLLVGAGVAALAAALVALPTSRLRGSQLAIATLGLSVMAPAWLFRQGFTGDQQVFEVPRVDFGLFELRPQRAYYLFVIVIAGVVVALLAAIGRRSTGRRWRAVRDNERAAASFGISPWRTRLVSFALSGAVAGLAGGLLAGLLVTFRRGEFTPEDSIEVVVMAVIGGLGSLPGAVIGVLYVGGLPAFFSDMESLQLLVSGVGLLALIIYFPDGLADLGRRVQRLIAGPSTPHDDSERPDATADPTLAPVGRIADRLEPTGPSFASGLRVAPDLPVELPLRARGVTVIYGVNRAVDDVDLDIAPGSIVGMIGPNGAGKTTLLNAISGLHASTGCIEIGDRDASSLGADGRARLGLGRTFQDARLFPNLTVRETVLVAAATEVRSVLVLDAIVPGRLRRSEARLAQRADAAIELTGLNRYAHERCAVLSTGMRRIVEMACLVASGSRVLLLDEPTAGLAQREVEAFPPLLRALRDHLAATILVVEHDVVMLSRACDRLVCLESGRIIADGDPDDVRNDPTVIESYLGPDSVAVDRSGTHAPSSIGARHRSRTGSPTGV